MQQQLALAQLLYSLEYFLQENLNPARITVQCKIFGGVNICKIP